MRAELLRPTCACTAPIMIRAGAVVCAACGSPIESVAGEPDVYASTGPLPRGWSRRRFLEAVRTMAGARRSGGTRGRGVVWAIDRADFDRGRVTERTKAQPAETAPVVNIDAWIGAADYRATRPRTKAS